MHILDEREYTITYSVTEKFHAPMKASSKKEAIEKFREIYSSDCEIIEIEERIV